jgi:hypothetical protein
VFGIGPQIEVLFPLGDKQGCLNSHKEFGATGVNLQLEAGIVGG